MFELEIFFEIENGCDNANISLKLLRIYVMFWLLGIPFLISSKNIKMFLTNNISKSH